MEVDKDSGGGTNLGSKTALRNEDFRQLLSKKGSSSSAQAAQQSQPTHSFSHRQNLESKRLQSSTTKVKKHKDRKDENDPDDVFGPSNLGEILKNYRDRAEERRKGVGKSDIADELQATNAYRAVPGDIRASADAAQRRKQAIQESKYLGGDMEHTHLVKGLDYSLLHKVRSEIATREQRNEELLEKQYNKETLIEELRSDNPMVRNIHRILFQNDLPERNELFRKGRMAYIIDFEDEENDLPTTRIRSVHDCPAAESSHDINASNVLIQKLSQVLSYLRADNQKKKKKTDENENVKLASMPIYDQTDVTGDRNRDRDRKRHKPASYFGESGRDEKERDRDRDRDRDRVRDRDRRRDVDKNRGRDKERRGRDEDRRDTTKNKEEYVRNPGITFSLEKKRKVDTETEGYAECYPGGIEMLDAVGESDDEADYSKMDMGSRRGPIKRWDFDDHADYEKYMESKEAMPKAAYQFGVKTNDGRRTRKSGNDKEKHKLDREYSQITRILEKRKVDGQKSDVGKRIKY